MTVSKLVGVLILLVLLVAILFSFPFISNTAEKVIDILFSWKKESDGQQTAGSLEAPNEIKQAYGELVAALRTESPRACILSFDKLPESFDDHTVSFSVVSDGIFSQLDGEAGNIDSQTIKRRNPCVVGLGGSALIFDDLHNLSGEAQEQASEQPEYMKGDIQISGSEDITIDQKSYQLEDSLVYVARDGNVCFFVTDSDLGSTCERSTNGIDTDCIPKLNTIQRCFVS